MDYFYKGDEKKLIGSAILTHVDRQEMMLDMTGVGQEDGFIEFVIDRINIAMKIRDMSKKDLAKKVGVSPSTMTLWLSRQRRMSTDDLSKIICALELPYTFFVTLEGGDFLRLGKPYNSLGAMKEIEGDILELTYNIKNYLNFKNVDAPTKTMIYSQLMSLLDYVKALSFNEVEELNIEQRLKECMFGTEYKNLLIESEEDPILMTEDDIEFIRKLKEENK